MKRIVQFSVISVVLANFVLQGCVEGEVASNSFTYEPDNDSDGAEDTDIDTAFDTGSPHVSDADADMDSDTDVDSDVDTDADSDILITSDPDTSVYVDTDSEEEVCGKEEFPIEAVPARVMLLQDISGSMNDNAGGGASKWEQAEQALTSMLKNYGHKLEIGFDAFPRNDACSPGGKVLIDSRINSSSTIINEFPSIRPNGSTPLLAAMKKFLTTANAPRFLSQDATSYLIIVSDGDDTCAGGFFQMGATAAQLSSAASSLLKQRGVRTFVIGFGDGASPTKLNAIAAAGGTGIKQFINAMDRQELTDALNQIGSSVVSCVYDLGGQSNASADPDKANFYFDDEVIGRDDGCAHGSGWQWANGAKTRVEFCKNACERLQAGQVDNISVTFGCKTIIIT